MVTAACIAERFDLAHDHLIAADWCEEHGDYMTAANLRNGCLDGSFTYWLPRSGDLSWPVGSGQGAGQSRCASANYGVIFDESALRPGPGNCHGARFLDRPHQGWSHGIWSRSALHSYLHTPVSSTWPTTH